MGDKKKQKITMSSTEIWNDFKSNQCLCEKRKKIPRISFCASCFYKLPKKMRRDLYKGFGDGYEAAFLAAVNYLWSE